MRHVPNWWSLIRSTRHSPRPRYKSRASPRLRLPSLPKVRVLPENNTRQGFFERPDSSSKVLPNPENTTKNPSNRSRHLKWWLLVNVYTCITDRAPEQESIRSPIERAIASTHRRAEHLRGQG